MATEVYTPETVQGHRMKPDIEIDEDGITWLLVETQYGSYKANHAIMTAPPPAADPISVRMGFDPGNISVDSILYAHAAASVLRDKPGPFTFDVL